MTNTELKAIVQREEYDFLRTNKHLGSNILFLTLSGSHAYGTNVEGSDIDIRGVAGSPEILGFNHFEQAIDNRTDTVIYAVNKFVGLLAQGNPSIIELLGNDPELYVNMTPEGQMLLDNRELFLTRRIAYSYGGFANDQLRRLQMGLLRNRVSPEALKNKFEKRSLERAIAGWGKDNIFEITISEDADEEGKHPLLISGSLNDYPVTSLKSLLKSLTTTIDQYEQPQHPKAQKDAAHIYAILHSSGEYESQKYNHIETTLKKEKKMRNQTFLDAYKKNPRKSIIELSREVNISPSLGYLILHQNGIYQYNVKARAKENSENAD